jgi:hypothetical protein
VKIDTTLRQWCQHCAKVTASKRCIYPPDICCAECCAPGRPACLIQYEYGEGFADEDGWEDG